MGFNPNRVTKRILFAGHEITVECILSDTQDEILNVVFKFSQSTLSEIHLTYHGDQHHTHVRQEQIKTKDRYKFIATGNRYFVSTVWITGFSKNSEGTVADIIITSLFERAAFRFCITPTNAIVASREEIYLLPGSLSHCHVDPHSSIVNLVTTEKNVLDMETLKTCCAAIKRPAFNSSVRDINSVVQRFGVINDAGILEEKLFSPVSLFEPK